MITYYENYTPVGDVTVLGLCLVVVILMAVAYNIKSKNYRILQLMTVCLMIAASCSIGFHMMLNSRENLPVFWIYLFRFLQRLALFMNLFLFVIYVMEPLQLDKKIRKRFLVIDVVMLILLVGHDLLGLLFGYGFRIDENNAVHEGFKYFFPIGYMCYIGIITWLLLVYRGRLVRQIMNGIIGTFGLSIIVMLSQGLHGQVSFTCVAFIFPIITLMYLIHSNPYNIEIGTVNLSAFEDMVDYVKKRHENRLFISLLLPDFEGTGKHYPHELQMLIREFTGHYFRGAVLFQLSNGRMLLAVDMKRNPDFKESIESILKRFKDEYETYQYDFKVVILTTVESISEHHDYIRLLQYIEKSMDNNSVHKVDEKDIANFSNVNYVLSQLEDIKRCGNLDDPRIEVYTQPVYNIFTKKYDTAEALMRMRLPKTGMVFPDVFIPLAEEYNYIHTLSLIILHKTCLRIRDMIDSKFNVKRISVNFSVSELRDRGFCSDIKRVIEDVGIPYDKIAIEITESQNDQEFLIVKDRIEELRNDGIKFYLDDFGTGYSNFERIMELPFDIIKFDRSLVIACNSDEKSERMVTHLAKMFSAMDYAVLYEGVETDEDEEKCIRMSAKYLQGYKYSKPIPIDELIYWFEKTA
ncbi:MAG: EAL domain-containing protein [Eubacterium sp.]|nr:EAL domain-containing protein [Eubacterium sp.]